MSRYRINFGNGQVHGDYATLKEAETGMRACNPDGYTYLEKYIGDGEWRRVKKGSKS